MGCSFSSEVSPTLENTCVVHLSGYVEEFEHPITVSQVTGNPPRHLVCTRAQLLSGGLKALKPDTQLESRQVYFLLPYSLFGSDVSPIDLASIARKLTKAAKTSQSKSKAKSKSKSGSGRTSFSSSPYGLSPVWSSPASSPNRFADRSTRVEPENGVVAYGLLKSPKARSWKPILDTIREKSFNRRSESDLQENHLETPK